LNDRHSGPDFHRDKLQPESRVSGENRDPVSKMVPDFRRDDAWTPAFAGETTFYETIHEKKRAKKVSPWHFLTFNQTRAI
jgi:hypothetical protein